MKILLKIFCIIILATSCTTTQKEKIISHVTILDEVDFTKLDLDTFDLRQHLKHRRFNYIKADITNNSDSVLYYWTNSCSWQSNWIINIKAIKWYVMCPKNVPVLVKLPPHSRKSYLGIIEFADSTLNYRKMFRIGFVFITKNEVRSDLDFHPVLENKLQKGKNIFWSNSVKPKQIY